LPLLILASLLWSVSFALIKSSGIHPDLLSAARLGLAALIFLPVLLRRRDASDHRARGRPGKLALIGAVQFGLMYVLVMRSYEHLAGFEVALLTVTTPIFVVLFEAALARRVAAQHLLGALIAVVAALVLRWPDSGSLATIPMRGFALVAGANAAWALGQILYRRLYRGAPDASAADSVRDFGWLYLGAFAVAGPWAAAHVGTADLDLTASQMGTVLYLGLIPSGLAFYLWNRGALAVNVGTLAVLNNLKVPLAVLVALSPPFSEPFDGGRLLGSGLVLALALAVSNWRSGAHGTSPST
jgi:drug/metabolite transporter (DMT)-like permease